MKKNTSSKIDTFTVFHANSEEYHQLKQEIFTKDTYYFESDSPTPRIIDAGAHIGLATLYFKKLYPEAVITAIEPNPISFSLLEQNIFENQLSSIDTHQCALGESQGETTYYRDKTKNQWHSTGGFIEGAWTNQQESESLPVTTHALAEFITEPIDFLKMDIEGAEQATLAAAGDSLKMVKELIVEFHPHRNQSLEDMLRVLDQYFSTSLYKDGKEVGFTKARGLIHLHGLAK